MFRVVFALAILLTACTGTPAPSPTTLPETPPPEQAATSTSATTGVPDGEIFDAEVAISELAGYLAISTRTEVSIVRPDGTTIWAGDVENPNSQPTWSPLGDLAYAETSGDVTEIIVVRPDASVQTIPTPVLAFYMHWSPDGRSIGVLGNGGQAIAFGVATPETDTFEIVDTGTPYYFDWNPDSSSVIAHVGAAEVREVTSASNQVEVIELTGAAFQTPQWTMAGVLLQRAGRITITASGLSTRLQSSSQDIVLGALGTEGEVVATILGVGSFSANIDGDVAVHQTHDAGTRLSIFEPNGAENVLTEKAVLAFQWSPDGKKLAFLEQVTEDFSFRWVVWAENDIVTFDAFVPSFGFMTRYQPFWDQYSRSLTIWSPGSDAIAYSAQAVDDPAAGVIYVQPISTATSPIEIGNGDTASWSFTP